jgi:trimeric autotransporter adhesin
MKILLSSRIRRPAAAALALATLVLGSTASTALAALAATPDSTYQTNGRVHTILRVDGVVYVGGAFSSVRPAGDPLGTGEVPRSNVFAVNAHTGALLSWNPSPNGIVRTLAAGPSGATIFMGGDFTAVGGAARGHLAAVGACTNLATCTGPVGSWSPDTNGNVFALATLGTRVYVGGSFGSVNGTAKKNLAAVGLSSGKLLKWGGGADNEVRAVLVTPNGTRVMVGGYFHHVGTSLQDHLAALNAVTGAPTPWLSHPPFAVLGLGASSSTLYGGGAGGGGHMPAYRLSDGHLRWQAVTNGDITQVSMYHGEVFAVGHFNTFGAQSRRHLALINGTTGKVDLTWHPSANSPLGAFAGLAYGQQVYAGGDFTKIGGVDQQGFAAFSDTVADNTAPAITRAPDVRMAAGTTIGTTYIPVTLSWAGTDNLSGICRYTVQEAINSGAFANAVPAFPKATSMLRSVRPNFSYHFKAAAKDCSDNASGLVSGPTDRISIFQNSSPAIGYAGRWTRARVSGSSGGSISYTTQRNASAVLHFTGRQVAWVASRSAGRGRAAVYIDGHLIKVVDLHSLRTARRQIVFVRTFASAAAHTIRIVCQGTAGRPMVDVDAFLVLR